MTLVASAAAGRTGKNPIDVAREKTISVVANALVRAVIESAGPRSGAVAAVRGVGGTVEVEYEDLVQALVPPPAG
jgi:hypothetical protein